ncbi:hypothetical protein COV82_04155 [Candidatus Peregrinibacteria bacterium CG11_big_fil_rev_8_21_14_0_20_46_8]|nr:MAG: hypothetical protein COV82_04155 [Candidatus Peregrinibacteria bacterium CG11_big_fil_rev_8_21_14_0_20_46_8]
MRFSIIIPTYNRLEKLKQCLKALEAQEFDARRFEIIVVNDGSTDETQKYLEWYASRSKIRTQILEQKNQGQGVARNRGVEVAQGELILLIGDDIVATPTLLKEHSRVHDFHPEEAAGVLGFITWHPKLPVSSLMRFMERGGAILGRFGGHQFAYDLLEGKRMADFRFFYTSNLSLKRSLLQKHKFDPWFAGYGWEDIELGYRLQRDAELKLYYEPAAVAYHDHHMSLHDFERRMYNIGQSSHRIHTKYPELGRVPSQSKRRLLGMLSSPIALRLAQNFNEDLYFYLLSKKHFLLGLQEGYNNQD